MPTQHMAEQLKTAVTNNMAAVSTPPPPIHQQPAACSLPSSATNQVTPPAPQALVPSISPPISREESELLIGLGMLDAEEKEKKEHITDVQQLPLPPSFFALAVPEAPQAYLDGMAAMALVHAVRRRDREERLLLRVLRGKSEAQVCAHWMMKAMILTMMATFLLPPPVNLASKRRVYFWTMPSY